MQNGFIIYTNNSCFQWQLHMQTSSETTTKIFRVTVERGPEIQMDFFSNVAFEVELMHWDKIVNILELIKSFI